jgi:hypothetical protein
MAYLDLIDMVMKWLIIPLLGAVAIVWSRQLEHHVEIAVLKANHLIIERDRQDNQAKVKEINEKLDRIVDILRKEVHR